MKKYTRLEVAAIFAKCENINEIFKACRVFKYFADEFGDPLPMYINLWANACIRHLSLKRRPR